MCCAWFQRGASVSHVGHARSALPQTPGRRGYIPVYQRVPHRNLSPQNAPISSSPDSDRRANPEWKQARKTKRAHALYSWGNLNRGSGADVGTSNDYQTQNRSASLRSGDKVRCTRRLWFDDERDRAFDLARCHVQVCWVKLTCEFFIDGHPFSIPNKIKNKMCVPQLRVRQIRSHRPLLY